MKKLLLTLGLSLVLAGCGVQQYNSHYGYRIKPTTKQQKAKHLVECATLAANKVPVSTQVGVTPRYTSPVYCNTYGNVSSFGSVNASTNCTGGNTIGGNAYSYDANAELRNEIHNQCMAEKGYLTTSFPIPICKSEQIPAGYVNPRTILQIPIRGSCVIEGDNQYSGTVVLLPEDQLVPNEN